MADRIGQQFGQYRLIHFVGKSIFAEVYLGEHVRLLTQAAVKVWDAQLASEEQERFQKEAHLVARLDHPHIARVFDCASEVGTPFLVLDYAPNGTLRQKFPRGIPQAPGTILPYVWQVADALHYAHGQRLIHRNLKPENMLLDVRDQVLLSDFGVGPLFQGSRYQATQEILGTVTYMAPEQIRANARSAIDQYALAIIVYEWLCGEPPFQGSMKEVMEKHLFAEPLPLHKRVRTISPAIEAVVMGALSKDPADRFPSVESFATAFEEACQAMPMLLFMTPRLIVPPAAEEDVAGPTPAPSAEQNLTEPLSPPPAAPADTPVSSSTPPVEQPPIPMVLSASAAYPLERADRLEPPAPPALAQGKPEITSQEVDWTPATTATDPVPAFSPPIQLRQGLSRRAVFLGGATGFVAVAGALTYLGVSKIFAHPLRSSGPITAHEATATPITTATPTPIPLGTTLYTYRGHSSFLRSVSWSLDGKRIASASDDHTAQVWDAFTGSQAITYKGHSREVMSVAWSLNDANIASGSKDQTLRVWDAISGTTLHSYTFGNWVMSVAWSPDGKYLAAGSWDDTVQVWDTATWQRVHKFNAPGRVNVLAWSPDSTYLACGDSINRITIWNVATGGIMLTYRHHTSAVLALAWSPDGTKIASGADLPDTTVQCWNTTNGQQLWSADMKDHTPSLAWSSNTWQLATGGSSAYLLNPSTGAQLFTRQGDAWTLAWSPNGSYIASGGSSTTVQVWRSSI